MPTRRQLALAGPIGQLLSAVLGAGAAAPVRASQPLRLATAYPTDNFHTINLLAFASDVLAKTNGRVAISVRPNGELLKASEIFRGAVDGRVEAGEVIMSSLSQEFPILGIDSFPFIASGYKDAAALWTASRSAVADELAKRSLRLLFAVPWQPQNLYSTRPITKASDFVGLKMRFYNPATKRIAELLGATPVSTPIQMPVLEKAIAAGEVDLMITSSWTGVATRAWSRMTHYYRINAWIPKNVVFVRQAALDQISKDDQRTLLDAAARAESSGWRLSEEQNNDLEQQLIRNRMNVEVLDLIVRRLLDRTGERLAKEWMAQAQASEVNVLSSYMIQRTITK